MPGMQGVAWIDEAARRLPPFPRIVLDLLRLLRDENASLDALARIARNDPVISASVLTAANRMRRLRALPDLKDSYVAASCIGTDKLRAIVVAAGMNRFLAESAAETFFFGHSLAVAIVAHELATLCSVPAEEAYVAGVLHDIGQLAFFVADADGYREVLRRAASEGDLLRHERNHFGVDHCQAGVALAAIWELPPEIVQAIAAHHEAGGSFASKVQALVNVAETVARGLDLPPSPANRIDAVNAEALSSLGLHWNMSEVVDCLGRSQARFFHALA
ncbi:MAG: HDOD domain-containing protein [Rhodocyclales bacterium]|nr:HDOD domain-containing protein [Rhodocyclales bacterium]